MCARCTCATTRRGKDLLTQAVDLNDDGTFEQVIFQADLGRQRDADVHAQRRRSPHPGARRVQGLRPVRPRAARRLRVGERSRRPPHVRRGARDVGAGAAHEQRRRRLGQAHAPARHQRLVHGRRLPPRQRGRRRPVLRRAGRAAAGATASGRTASCTRRPISATSRIARQRPDSRHVRADLRRLGPRPVSASPKSSA